MPRSSWSSAAGSSCGGTPEQSGPGLRAPEQPAPGYLGAMGIDLDQAFAFAGQHRQGVLATLKRDGRPQLSNILYLARERYAVRISVTNGRAKTKNLRRDPRASLHVTRGDFFAYVVLEVIHISEPTRRTPISYAVFCLKKKKR